MFKKLHVRWVDYAGTFPIDKAMIKLQILRNRFTKRPIISLSAKN